MAIRRERFGWQIPSEGDPAAMDKLAPGRIDVIENKDKREGEPGQWLRVYLIPEKEMTKVQALFTPEEVLNAVARVAENRTDIGDPKQPGSLIDRIQKAFNDAFDRLKK